MHKIGDRVRIKDYSQWDNIRPFKELVKRYTGRGHNGVMVVTGWNSTREYVKISSSIEDSLEIGSIYVLPSHLESVEVCALCQEDITDSIVKHPVHMLNGSKYLCEICNDYRLDTQQIVKQLEVD